MYLWVRPVTPFVWGYWPVMMLARLGEQLEAATKAFSNFTPSSARRSMFGVSMSGLP